MIFRKAHTASAAEAVRPSVSALSSGVAPLSVFAFLWALATLTHLYNSQPAAGFLAFPNPNNTVHALLGFAALLLLVRPSSLRLLLAVALLGPYTAWLEAPQLGNHWLLAALVNLALVFTFVVSRWGRPTIDRERIMTLFVPLARITVLVFYSFAALSKLNTAFLNPTVSCGIRYASDVLHTFGVPTDFLGNSFIAPTVPWLVVATECSIPLLLFFRRTRTFGVLFALFFHGVIALDLQHPFADFSAVLSALFVFFLPDDFPAYALAWGRAFNRKTGGYARMLLLVACAFLLIALWFSPPAAGNLFSNILASSRMPLWFLLDATLLICVITYLLQPHQVAERLFTFPRPVWLLVIPLLAVLNGIAPYLELKDAYGWNMYSNLVTIPGTSNSLLFPVTLHVFADQDHPVRILATSDPNLQVYINKHYDPSFPQLQAYLSTHPDTAITYQQNGVTYTVAHARDDPALVNSPPAWQLRLFPFRAVDQRALVNPSQNRCQERFLAAQ